MVETVEADWKDGERERDDRRGGSGGHGAAGSGGGAGEDGGGVVGRFSNICV